MTSIAAGCDKSVTMTRNVLAHHGIKGQQWGVRRGPPYPIDDKVLRKGTKVRHITNLKQLDPARSKERLYVFNPDDENDKRIYRGAYGTFLSRYRHLATEPIDKVRKVKTLFGTKEKHYKIADRVLYEHEFEVIEDLKMPTLDERKKIFESVLQKNYSVMVTDIKRAFRFFNQGNNNRLNTKDTDTMFFWMNRIMEDASANATKLYTDALRKNYDAVVDDNNVNIYNGAHDPIIILNRDKIKETTVQTIYSQDVRSAYQDLETILQAQGKKVLL